MTEQKKYDVFISYSRKDLEEVSTFVEMLKMRIPTLEVWMDLEGITAADEFDEKIISAIDASSHVIFAVSRNSNSIGEGSSKWTKKELVYAKNTGKKVIPVLLSGAELNSWFLFEFGRVDCIDSSSTHQIEKLLKNIAKWSNKELVKPQKDKKVLTINERQFIDDVNIIKSRITHRKQIAKKVTMIVVPAMLFLITSISIGINRYKAYNGIAWEYNILNDSVLPYTAEISGFEFINEYKSSKISIPKKIKRNDTTYLVKSIGNEAFKYCSSLISITIPNSVTNIGDRAFSDCSSLTSITIPNSVTSIGAGAFQYCESLTSIIIPSSTTSIGEGILIGCPSITSIVVRKGNRTYNSRNRCNAIIETASSTLIAGCQNTIIPENVMSIGESAFEKCEYLSSITIPNGVMNIEKKAFDSCTTLKSINIPENVTTIGEEAFAGCSSLTSIIIPNGITSIEKGTYSECSSLTSFTIPSSVTSIGEKAFYACEALKSINIPENVISIGKQAFFWCHSLASIAIPNNVAAIGKEAFARCSSLTSIVVGSGNSTYDSRNNCNAIIETASNTLIVGCQNTIIPENVMSIGDEAFAGCDSLTFVSIPKSTTSIGNLAFWGCNSLSSLTIPEGLMSIGNFAFDVCWSLTSITIPNSVTSIGEGAFAGCASLTSITIPNSVTEIGSSAFSGCSSLTSINIPNSVTSIGSWAFHGCYSLTSITIPNSVKSIGDKAFNGCSSLTSITIPNSVTSIGEEAFNGCFSLTSITIPSSTTSIGARAFVGTALYNEPSNWENGALYISECLIAVDTNCVGNYIIKENTRLIGDGAFISCSALTSVTIPNSVTSIGYGAFYACESLETIVFDGTMEQWLSIDMETYWEDDVPTKVIHCTDGDITLPE